MTRPVLALAALAAGATIALGAAPAVLAAPAASLPSRQALVVLLADHATRAAPGTDARRLGAVTARRPLTGVHTVLPLLGVRTDGRGARWLHVRLPGRPSGLTGWIAGDATRQTSTPWAIVVSLRHRQVTVFDQGRAVRRFTATVGRSTTPTPRGRFFVEEAVALAPGLAGSPFALASSARSSVLQEFDGGPGQIALHGTGQLSGGLGAAVSHGCVRLSTKAITWLARRVGAGVPLRIES
ncbi:L,D-transpeptidase [Baekduia sp. Peel2402]|uniref:L,D-transpeptidase n=1 Tax=Baekduia sp. Peel2402 TaxID=3458296 RepID=UPI00403E7425